jgi:metallo-beta-lactamase family protein
MQITFLGATRQVTGSCYLVDTGSRRLLIDCGLYQERELLERNWKPRPVDPGTIDALILTHAHLDHCGLLPKFVREGYSGPVYTTIPTVELAALVLRDSARIQEEDAAFKAKRHREEGRKGPHPEVPLYGLEDVEAALPLLHGVHYRDPIDLGDGVTVRLLEAGHILGAAIVEITVQRDGAKRRVVFSGDLGQWDVPIVPDPAFVGQADTVVCESTYGDGEHGEGTGPSIDDALVDAIEDTRRRGGKLLIPTFALERAQELLVHLGEIFHAKRVPRTRVFLDSPMAVDATRVYLEFPEFMDDEMRATLESKRLEDVRGLLQFVRTTEQSKALNSMRETCIILSGSGMCTGGRIKHHLRHNIEHPETTILFVGYQAAGTLGRQILAGEPEVRIHGQTFRVRAQVRQIQGLSAHADRRQLLYWFQHFDKPPDQLILTHGEEQKALALADRVRSELGWKVTVPHYLDSLEF